MLKGIKMPFFNASLNFKDFKILDVYLPFPINLWEVMGGRFDSWVNFQSNNPSFFNVMTDDLDRIP